MKFDQEFAAIDSEPKNVETCENALKFLDYLRKSQCTKTMYGSTRAGLRVMDPFDNSACEETLKKMEEVASACIRLKR